MSEHDDLNAISNGVIGAAVAVHHELGPGLLESAYETCLAYELLERGLARSSTVATDWISSLSDR